jgi:uncharacterized protein
VARIDARGKEVRGSGTARADLTARLSPGENGTVVNVVTDLAITGKPAQFGRGVLAEVGTNSIDTFAERLRSMLEEQEVAQSPSTGTGADALEGATTNRDEREASGTPAATAADAERRLGFTPPTDDDALDLFRVAGAATAKRVLPVVAGALVVLLVFVCLCRRRR